MSTRTYAENVERWRATVAKYVPAEYVDKVLWAINYESSGNPNAIGDNGVAIGLLQIHDNTSISGRPSSAQLLDPEFNIRYAAEQLGMATGDFRAWGDAGNTHNGNPFGAFGFHPYYPPDGGPNDATANPPANSGGGSGFFVDVFSNAFNALSPGAWAWNTIPGISNVPNPFNAVSDVASGVIQLLRWILDPRNWFRLFMIAGGITMMGAGAFIYVKGGGNGG